ncbi:MAG: PIN domain-containing protein [Thermoanaerobaculia bacterium]
MRRGLVADTGGLLRALACRQNGAPAWPEYAAALTQASAVIVPALVLTEVDYFLRDERPAMRKLIAELLDPATTYELEPVIPTDLVRALEIDVKFANLGLGLVDATVATVAERRKQYRILTTDRTHFSAIRVGQHYRQAFTLVP